MYNGADMAGEAIIMVGTTTVRAAGRSAWSIAPHGARASIIGVFAAKSVIARSKATKQTKATYAAPGLLRFARNDGLNYQRMRASPRWMASTSGVKRPSA